MQTTAFQWVHRSRLRCAFAVLLGAFVATAAFSQPSLSFDPPHLSVAPPPPPSHEQRAPGIFRRVDELVEVASESGVFVRFGDPMDSHDPQTFDVFWFDEQAQETGAVTSVYRPRGRLWLADDGKAAWTAPRTGDAAGEHVALYAVGGSRLWEHPLPAKRRTLQVAVDPAGEVVVVVMAPFRLPRDRDEALIFDRSGELERFGGLGMVKQILFPEGRREILVVGSHGTLLSNFRGDLLWQVTEELFPAGRRLAAASPDGKVLFLVEGSGGGRRGSRLLGLDLATGRLLATLDLPEGTPSGKLTVDQTTVRARVGNTVVETEWLFVN